MRSRCKREKERLKDPFHHRLVAGPHCPIEALCQLRHEIEHRRRIGGNADAVEAFCEELVGRHSAYVAEPVAELGRHVAHEVDFADTVLEADQVGAGLSQARNRVGIRDGIGAVVENDPETC